MTNSIERSVAIKQELGEADREGDKAFSRGLWDSVKWNPFKWWVYLTGKREIKEKKRTLVNDAEDAQEKCFKKYPVGSDIEYLGAKFRVTSHYRLDLSAAIYGAIVDPHIKCDYLDNEGVVRSWSFKVENIDKIIDGENNEDNQ